MAPMNRQSTFESSGLGSKTKSATEISLQLAGLGTELAIPVLLCAFLSVRYSLGLLPVLVGLALGITSTFLHVVFYLKRNPDMRGKNQKHMEGVATTRTNHRTEGN